MGTTIVERARLLLAIAGWARPLYSDQRRARPNSDHPAQRGRAIRAPAAAAPVCGSQPQQPPPQQPPPPAGAAGIGARPPAARPPRATVLSSFTVSACPCGQRAGSPAAAMGRSISKVVEHWRQRKS
jgi:hypothetical protein